MKHYKPSSELQRAAEQRVRNTRTITAWRKKQRRYVVEYLEPMPVQTPAIDEYV